MSRHSPSGGLRPRVWGAVVAAAAVLVTPALFAAAGHAQAVADCQVKYTVNGWSGGFTTDILVTNHGPKWNGWALTWEFAGDQRISNAWNGAHTQTGRQVTLRNVAWNGSVSSGASVNVGFLASYSGANAVPARFALNGVLCDGPGAPPPSPTPEVTTLPLEEERVDNPYRDGRGYVDPEWKAKAESVPGGARVSNTPTAVWLDGIGAIEGRDRNGTKVSMSLREHLDAALAQNATYVQLVIYNLPGRDCGGLQAHTELGATEIVRYEREFIDPIAAIQADPKYRGLRIVNIIEPESLPDLITSVSGSSCETMARNGFYQRGIAYALTALGAVPNAYNYLDASYHAWAGWHETFQELSKRLTLVAGMSAGGTASVHGFIVNTADYSPTVEPFLKITDTVGGVSVRQSKWVDWNNFVDEQSYATALRERLISLGFSPSIGMLVDTSRNGWGGPNRPTATSTSTNLNTYVDQSRIDRRFHPNNWCNQNGAGLGERPVADPVPGFDAYVWAKPPGESDGSVVVPPLKGFVNPMCEPFYGGDSRNNFKRSGALGGGPVWGEWFPAHFQMLMDNAHPPL